MRGCDAGAVPGGIRGVGGPRALGSAGPDRESSAMGSTQNGKDALERGEEARRDNRPADARAAFAEAADVFRRRGAWAELGVALTRQAQVERDTGAFGEAVAFQEEALAIARDLDDPKTLAHVARHMGDILQDAGRHKDADPHYREMLALYRAFSDVPPLELANALRSAALHQENLGNTAEARALWLEVRDLYAGLDAAFREMTGRDDNPGVAEAERRLAALTG